ncbi:protein s-acyltransferase 16-related [Anaeramoeba flamelloides]|uniref:Palmitoyltransferase n=1 Tax=Anaeramoeba flamelloides TaxID=1746091 RepID=A0ABQ8Z565_9EUKA|nr:protein s-acyltransferase 16-related [Anaeramoeba flamelloides]
MTSSDSQSEQKDSGDDIPTEPLNTTQEPTTKIKSNLTSKFLCISKYSNDTTSVITIGSTPLGWDFFLQMSIPLSLFCYIIFVVNILATRIFSEKERLIIRVVFNFFAGMSLFCYLRTTFTSPGYLPPEWKLDEYRHKSAVVDFPLTPQEHFHAKHRPRPPRSRYSKKYHVVALKADHICYIVGNMIGFRNYKFFLLVLFYFDLSSILSTIILSFAIIKSENTFDRISAYVAISICCFFFIFLTRLILRHTRFVFKNLTTIENYHEKKDKGTRKETPNIYDLGKWKNTQQVFGKNPLFWCLPVRYGIKGDGYTFKTNTSEPNDDIELDEL